IYWHRGRCLSYGEGVVFWALAEIVRQRLGIAEEDPLTLASSKLANSLEQFLPVVSERAYVGVRLGRLLGVPVADDNGATLPREELFAGWRLFFERLAEVQPVALLIEDAHYADSELLAFLSHLVDWARESPIYVLAFARPELEEIHPGVGVGRNRSTLTLDPLDTPSMETLVDALVPSMPPAARAAITAQAQGIPLFAVETVRSLVDRDIVVPQDGVYRLVGNVGELTVPDSLHSLLAARLDGLDPDLRELVSDAAVLGTSFPASALVAISSQTAQQVQVGLTELLRREVLSVSADKLSPQQGDYRFSQELLRQVAYETLSRRDRKARHLAVARHLLSAFPGDGDEMSDVIARHYVDALAAVPDANDAPELRQQAIAALIRAAERSTRSGAPAGAAASYAAAAEHAALAQAVDAGETRAPRLWESAARAALTAGEFAGSVAAADQAATLHTAAGDPRGAARAHTQAGRALRLEGRFTEARERLTAGLEGLQTEPDADTVQAMAEMATLELFQGGPDADRLTSEALNLGQDLDVDESTLTGLFVIRGIAMAFMDHPIQAGGYFEVAVRLAESAGDSGQRSRALLNLADVLTMTDATAGAEAARAAVDHARRVGDHAMLPTAISNLSAALIFMGEWDEAERVLRESQARDHFPVDTLRYGVTGLYAAVLPALRGDLETAERLAQLPQLRASEDPQDQNAVTMFKVMLSVARNDPRETLRLASLVDHASMGISHETVRWTWPIAARAAHDLGDTEAVLRLLGLLEAKPVGKLPPLLRAEQDLARARLAARSDDPGAEEAFNRAITGLRKLGSPYHLAHGLLDQADFLIMSGEPGAIVAQLVDEARAIATRLRAVPVLDRATRVERTMTGRATVTSEPAS
ncbi:MAG: ATP-binding protein, partial [Nocardioidaceae bacterium]